MHRLRARCILALCSGTRMLSTTTRMLLTNVHNWQAPGYFRLQLDAIDVRPECYRVNMTRGSGPGGQGMQSSSNCVELRLSLEAMGLDAATLERLKKNEERRITMKSGSPELVVCSHAHRSAKQNQDECIAIVRELIHKASWVPPVAAPPHELSHRTLQKAIDKRRKKSMQRKAIQSVRMGRG